MPGYIEFKNVKKKYKMGEVEIEALSGVDFSINKGEFIVVAGASGAGKSTILNILGGMDTASEGQVIVDNKDISQFSQKDLITYRRYDIGFVFQFFNLIPILTVEENICLPMIINGKKISKQELDQVIKQLDLTEKRYMLPSRLSGGQQQRVAIGRAIISKPNILLADEPTGNLDSENAENIIQLLERLNRSTGQTIVMVTHDKEIAKRCTRQVELSDGNIMRVSLWKNLSLITWFLFSHGGSVLGINAILY